MVNIDIFSCNEFDEAEAIAFVRAMFGPTDREMYVVQRATRSLRPSIGTLCLIACAPEGARLVAEQQFTASELTVLLPLLKAFPHFCPNEVLLASLFSQVTRDEVERCRKKLLAAKQKGTWDQEMRPVRNMVSRVRIKMRNFGVKTYYILEVGYGLMPSPSGQGEDE